MREELRNSLLRGIRYVQVSFTYAHSDSYRLQVTTARVQNNKHLQNFRSHHNPREGKLCEMDFSIKLIFKESVSF